MSKKNSTKRIDTRWTRFSLLLVGILAAMAAFAPSGQAAFTTGQCLGSDVTGRGASFARDLHVASESVFENFFCASAGVFPEMTYEPLGSGAGRRVLGERTGSNADGSQSRNQPPRFGMSDEPPTPTGVAQMNAGTGVVGTPNGDEGQVHVVPAGVGSVAMFVNFPDNCDRSLLPDASETNPSSANSDPFIDRVRFSRAQFEEIWNGDSSHDNWQEIFPELVADADCNKDITRVVRFDDSGTSFAFKDFLDNINPSRDWIPTYTTGPDTRNWPNASIALGSCASNGPTGTHLVTGCSNGNGPLMTKLAATDGGVGYSDISTGRSAGFDLQPGSSRDDDKFMVPVQDDNAVWQEPTSDPDGFRTDGDHGANCTNAVFTGIPATTLGDWSQASGADSVGAYGACTLTFGLVFDDNSTVYGNTAAEEAKARSVKDYWSSIVTPVNQNSLTAYDYGALPANILAISQAGVAQVGWNKAGGGGGPGPGGGGGPAPGGDGGGGGGGSTPPPSAPSNAFSIASALVATNGSPTVTVNLPGAGKLDVAGTAKTSKASAAKTIKVGSSSLNVPKAGAYKVTLKLTSAAKKALKKSKKLKVAINIKFTPTGGSAKQVTRSLTLKAKKKGKK